MAASPLFAMMPSYGHYTVPDHRSASIPVTLTALEHLAQPAPSDDSAVRSAIVSVTNYYLRLAQGKTPAEMEALIWQQDSTDGADHGESCAAFASMTLALAAQLVGRQSWVTGGSTYPWPLQDWADVRVDPNPASLGITSMLQDAQAHQRWHPLGDGYQPLPGDWVLFDGHVEVVTKYSGGVLSTVGGDSLPNFSVNAHEYPAPLGAQGVAGFVSNGNLPAGGPAAPTDSPASAAPAPGTSAPTPATAGSGSSAAATQQTDEQSAGALAAGALAAVPGTAGVAPAASAGVRTQGVTIPGLPAQPAITYGPPQPAITYGPPQPAITYGPPQPAITYGPPQPAAADPAAQPAAASHHRHQPAPAAPAGPWTRAQQAFIQQVAPGAVAAQRAYGVPAAVTIAQAIAESGWGQSTLAVHDHNLFGIKGIGPAGSAFYPTQQFKNGQWVTINALFRVYHDIAQSIEDHSRLLATSRYYTAAMAARQAPDSFAQALTGVYATDPNYGSNLVSLMQRFNLYRFGNLPPCATDRAIPSDEAEFPGYNRLMPTGDSLTPSPTPEERPTPPRTRTVSPARQMPPSPIPSHNPSIRAGHPIQRGPGDIAYRTQQPQISGRPVAPGVK